MPNSLRLFALALLGGALPAAALTIAIDLDPGAPGIQGTRTVEVGDPITVDILVAGSPVLSGFELDLNYDPFLTAATGIRDGGFVVGDSGSLLFEEDLGPPAAGIGVVALGVATGAGGDGVLASVDLVATGVGSLSLFVDDAILLDALFAELAIDALEPATLEVAPAPAPGPLALLGSGLLALGLGRWVAGRVARTAPGRAP